MIQKYKTVSIVYGGSGKKYAAALNEKILELSKRDRYPVSSKLIMESILTQELLSGVIDLFKESDVCVAFLTADDYCATADGERRRIRQNIVFELGMAILQLGRERCILLSDFDVNDANLYELPSDMNSLEIRQFSPKQADLVIQEVLKKILTLSNASDESGDALPRYDRLLLRDSYYVDYENIFRQNTANELLHGTDFLKKVLEDWLQDCLSFTHYDERCVYLLERIGFLPIFGKIPEVVVWLNEAIKSLEHYTKADVAYYGGTTLLEFTHRLLHNVITYTKIKREDGVSERLQYEKLLDDFLFDPPPSNEINPLLLVTYYDYLGLTYMRMHRLTNDQKYVEKAKEAFEITAIHTEKVDMSLRIWSGFLYYNLARAHASLSEQEKSLEYYDKAVRIRRRWLSTSQYNVTVRNALSYEYFLAKIDYVNTMLSFDKITKEEWQKEYENLEIELNTYADTNDSLERLLYIRNLLHSNWEDKEEE